MKSLVTIRLFASSIGMPCGLKPSVGRGVHGPGRDEIPLRIVFDDAPRMSAVGAAHKGREEAPGAQRIEFVRDRRVWRVVGFDESGVLPIADVEEENFVAISQNAQQPAKG